MANRKKGVNSNSVQKAFKENNVTSRVELYNLYASGVGCVYLGDENVGSMDSASWKCSKGHVFTAIPNTIQQGHGCPCCNGPVQKTLKENNVNSKVELYNLRASRVGCVYLGDGTVGSQDLADWKCSKGHVFKAIPHSIQQGFGCPFCNGTDMKYVLLRESCKTLDEYGHKLAAENPNNIKYVRGFVTTKIKAEWECSKGHRWKAVPNQIGAGTGCPYCNSKRIKYVLLRNNCETLDEYGHKLAKENPNDIKYVGGYINNFTKAKWECNRSNHRWEATPSNIKSGWGCPKCALRFSKKEQALFLEIQKFYPDAISNTRQLLKNNYELDIYVPSLNKAIEFDGTFWHGSKFPDTIRRDTEKDQMCTEADIALYRVKESDWDADKDLVVKNVLEFLK